VNNDFYFIYFELLFEKNLKQMKKVLLFLFGLFICGGLFSQEMQVSGIVTDNTGLGLPGVSVFVKGTTNGTVTSMDGDYSIKIDKANGELLVFSFIGFDTQEVNIKGKARIDVLLKVSTTDLEEVVAIGYGTMKKKSLTGSISSVSSKDIMNMPTVNVATALAGKVSGVQITSSEGSPDAGITIRVRGGGSITQSNSPLYVIDGFPSEDGINFIDPSDIETVDILKDASSAAIYGARGANGVILITTKSGEKGKTRISVDSYIGFKNIAKKMDMMNPYDFVKLQYENQQEERYSEGFKRIYGEYDELESLYSNREGIDWQDEVFGGNATIKKHKFSVSGGTKATKYSFSFARDDNEGVMVNSGFERNSMRLKLDQKINDFIKASVNTSYLEQKTYGMGTSESNSNFNKLTHIARYRPTIGKEGNDRDLIDMDEDPAFADDEGNVQQNPLVSAIAEHRSNDRKITTINASFDFDLAQGLTARLSGGLKNGTQRIERFDGERSVTARRKGSPFGSISYRENRDWSYATTLNYKKNIGGLHRVNLLVGHEQVHKSYKNLYTEVTGFPNDDIGLGNMGLGIPSKTTSYNSETGLISFFGRANYSLKDKYLLTATFRADASSKFGKDNLWGYFPSASLAWRISDEDFLASADNLSNMKLRVSYGASGNDRIGIDLSKSQFALASYGFNNGTEMGVVPTNIPNSGLKWETTYSGNIGLDLGFYNQRIIFTSDFYKGNTRDLLLNKKVPLTTGYSTQMVNIGETENMGMEFSLNTVNIRTKDFEWTSNINISFNKNEVKKLADGQTSFMAKSGWYSQLTDNDYLIRVGDPLGQMYGYVLDEMYRVSDFDYDSNGQNFTIKDGVAFDGNDVPQPGTIKYKDISGPDGVPDGKIDADDRTVIGNANPIHFGGFTNTFRYKQFDLSVFMNWSYGNDVYNANKIYYTRGFERHKNVLAVLNDRWTNVDGGGQFITNPAALAEMNKNAKYPSYDGNTVTRFHSGAVEDASFLRISNVTLGYNLPKRLVRKMHLNRLRVYATANNLYTFTNYSGFDPEVSTRNRSGLTPGVDWGAYPRSKTYILGVNISL